MSFCSFKKFSLKISLSALLFEVPLIKVEACFSDEQDRKVLSLYETMYVKRALGSMG